MERLREALKYFGLPQYLPGKEPTASNCYSWFVHSKSPTGKSASSEEKASESKKDSTSVDQLAKDLSQKLVTTDSKKSDRTNAGKTSKDATDSKGSAGSKALDKDGKGAVDGQVLKGPSVSDFNFVFDKEILTGGEKVPLICSGCGIEGHVEKVIMMKNSSLKCTKSFKLCTIHMKTSFIDILDSRAYNHLKSAISNNFSTKLIVL